MTWKIYKATSNGCYKFKIIKFTLSYYKKLLNQNYLLEAGS